MEDDRAFGFARRSRCIDYVGLILGAGAAFNWRWGVVGAFRKFPGEGVDADFGSATLGEAVLACGGGDDEGGPAFLRDVVRAILGDVPIDGNVGGP